MANPSGRTFHYSQEKINQPGYPGIVHNDGGRVQPGHRFSKAGTVEALLRDHPIPMFLGAVAVGYLTTCLLSKC